MSGEPDVVVVGAGVAGFAAALAASQAGASVVVLESGAGASHLGGGAWDVASDLAEDAESMWREPRTVGERIVDLAQERPHHPYARLDDDAIELVQTAHATVLGALGGYGPLDLDGPGPVVATELGLLRRVATAQVEVLDLTNRASGTISIAVPGDYPELDPGFLASSLEAHAASGGRALRFSGVETARLLDEAPGARIAHELALAVDGDEGLSRLVQMRDRIAGDAEAVLVAPVLGMERADVRKIVERELELPVGELIASLAGPQGLRLERRIRSALDEAGCRVRSRRVGSITADRDNVRVTLEEGVELRPGALVLATGKHVGGGLEVEGDILREPLAGLPIYADGRIAPLPSSPEGPDPAVLFGRDFLAGGPGYRQGVGYDAALRALGRDGEPVSRRLFVAGALLDGVDPSRDGSGLGCCAVTGYQAGLGAASAAGAEHGSR